MVRNLKNGFRLVTASVITLLVAVSVAVAVGVFYVHDQVARTIELDELILDLHQLRILGAEFGSAPADRVHHQWRVTYDRVRGRVVAQGGMPDEVREVLSDMDPLFERFAELTASQEPGSPRRRLAKQVAATLDLEAQRVIDWASSVSHRSKSRIVPRLAIVAAAVLAATLLVALATVATMLLSSRRILGAIANLKEGAAQIASGRLGFQVESAGDDEMASLAASISQMSRDLAGTYERLRERTRELEAEAAERARVEREHSRLEAQYRQAQKMEAVGLLAGGIAHDFNNVLSVIMACGSMLRSGASGDEARECVVEILRASNQAAELTRGLLAFGRKQAFALERCELGDLAEENIRFLKRVIGEDVELILERSPTPVFALVDRSQIQQVLMNLAANARDAMPSGGRLTIRIGAEAPDDDVLAVDGYGTPGEHALIRVSDTGVGMAKETVDRIFEPFFTTKEKGRGTGLGLSITHGIIVQHRGHIVCRSTPGVGTTFSVYLPACAEEAERPAVVPADARRSLRGSETLLVAEDDEMVMATTTRICRANGYTVLQSRDGAEAIALFKRHADEIDLVILDAIMPKLTGKEAWDAIAAVRPGVKGCFVSGYANDPLSGKMAIDTGLPFVSKPFTPDELLRKIREILDGP
jgi:signal transduction histidine kinase